MITRIHNILYILAILFLYCCGLERIDFLQEEGVARLTPSIITASLFFGVYCVLSLRGLLYLNNRLEKYFKLLVVFLGVIFLSVLLSNDFETSIKRFILLFIYALSGLLSISCIYKRKKMATLDIVSKAMIFMSLINGFFIVLDYLNFYGIFDINLVHGLFPFFDTSFARHGAFLIRAKGISGDPNRMAIFMMCIITLLVWNNKKSVFRYAIIILNIIAIILSLSRTGYLCLCICMLILYIENVSLNRMKGSHFLYGIVALVSIVWTTSIPFIQVAIETVILRFIHGDDSGSSHISLILDGLKIAFSDLKIFLFGNGYQASSNLLFEYFEGNVYSNFHNAYISFFVESGFFSLVLFIAILILPLITSRKTLPLVVCLIIGNISYQIFVESYFWLLLPMSYLVFDSNKGVRYGKISLCCYDKL